MASTSARSSLEAMLDTIRRRNEQPKDLPPALPTRPISRGRLPSTRRSLPVNFSLKSNGNDMNLASPERGVELKEEIGLKGGFFARVEKSSDIMMPTPESYRKRKEEDKAMDHKCTSASFAVNQLAMPETAGVSRQHGIVCIQKYIRGARARHVFKDVKNGVTTLQSFIRAERARNEFHHLTRQLRSAVLIQKHVKRWISVNAYAKQQKHLMLLQSVIRGCLARKHFSISRNLEMTECKHLNLDGDQIKWLYELKISDVIELKNGVLKVEAELKRKEEENSSLRQQLQQHENRWADYYGKMKSLEETWEKQITSLKMSLAAAKRSLATNNVTSIAGRPDASPNIRFFDSEDAMSVENYTTEGTPATRPCASGAGLNRTSDGLRNTIGHLVKEFEERRHIFEDEAGFLVDVKSGKSISNLNPDEELSKLKAQFVSWKKNFKVRLLETKLALQKHGNPETRKMRRKWWGNWSSK